MINLTVVIYSGAHASGKTTQARKLQNSISEDKEKHPIFIYSGETSAELIAIFKPDKCYLTLLIEGVDSFVNIKHFLDHLQQHRIVERAVIITSLQNDFDLKEIINSFPVEVNYLKRDEHYYERLKPAVYEKEVDTEITATKALENCDEYRENYFSEILSKIERESKKGRNSTLVEGILHTSDVIKLKELGYTISIMWGKDTVTAIWWQK